MEIRKMPKLDLERKRPLGLLIGFAIALLLLLAAFQLSVSQPAYTRMLASTAGKEEMVPITVQEVPRAPLKTKTVENELTIPSTENFAQQVEETENVSYYTEEPRMIIVTSHYSIKLSQPEEPKQQEEIPARVTEYQPEFPGGQAALLAYLRRNVNYPVLAQESGIQGRVIIQFVVNRDGTVTEPVVLRSVHPVLDREAVRVVSSMPRWRPGMQDGKPIRATYAIPVSFKLN